MSFKGQIKVTEFKNLYLINNAFYDQGFMKYIDSMSYMDIQLIS